MASWLYLRFYLTIPSKCYSRDSVAHGGLCILEQKKMHNYLVMGLDQKFLTHVGSGSFFSSQVGFGQPPLGLENLPQKSLIFQFFRFGSKKSRWVRSKHKLVSPLFTAGQKYAQVGSGQGPSLHLLNFFTVKVAR